jgi:DNA uptake protein ComE-like DNA-binding protein
MRHSLSSALIVAALASAACGGGDAAEQAAATDSTATAVPATPAPAPATAAPADSAATAAPAPAAAEGALIDPNTATREQLAAIPGMTPQLADAVVQGRPYADMRAVDQKLAGLTEQQKDQVYAQLWKPIDLNRATREEIELIPGVGARMRHEFEEYRPYRGMEQFRREIGKYVNEAEVARLEKYVSIPAS